MYYFLVTLGIIAGYGIGLGFSAFVAEKFWEIKVEDAFLCSIIWPVVLPAMLSYIIVYLQTAEHKQKKLEQERKKLEERKKVLDQVERDR